MKYLRILALTTAELSSNPCSTTMKVSVLSGSGEKSKCLEVSLVAQLVKNLPAMQEIQVQSLGQKDILEKQMQPILVCLPGESHGQRSLAGYSPWGRKCQTRLSDWATTEGLRTPPCVCSMLPELLLLLQRFKLSHVALVMVTLWRIFSSGISCAPLKTPKELRYSQFTDENTEAQRGNINLSKVKQSASNQVRTITQDSELYIWYSFCCSIGQECYFCHFHWCRASSNKNCSNNEC